MTLAPLSLPPQPDKIQEVLEPFYIRLLLRTRITLQLVYTRVSLQTYCASSLAYTAP